MAGQQYGNGNVKMPKGMRQEILTDTFTPRAFQVELLDVARERNTIVCLGTGMGKTFIAVMLIKELSYQIHGSYNEGGKRTIFLVTTVPLVDQQGGVIKRQTNLSVGTYIGAMGVDLWSMRRWQGELASHHVLVMTAQIFLDMLLHGFVQLSRVNLLVMDECHHATGAHPYREIMRCQDVCALADRPLVLGLTASILNATCHSPAQLEQLIISLETTLRSAAQTTADMMSTDMYATRPQEVMMHYSSDPDCALIEVLAGPLNDAANFISAAEAGSRSGSQRDRWTIPRTIVSDCTYILYTLGPWCAGRLAKNLSWQLSKSINKECDTLTRALLNYTSTQLRMLQRMVDMHFDDHVHTLDDFISLLTPRTVCLVEIIRDYRPPDNFYIRDGDPANMDIDADHTDGSENSLDLSDSESQAARNSWCKSPTKKKTRRRAADKSAAADKMEYVAVAREVVTDGTEAGGKEEDALCGIIFVDRRNTAFALAKLLDKLCEWDESLFFLHSRHITGSVSGVAGGEHSTATQLRQQEQALRQFRQRDVNLLVSTSVLEEGVDVPRCNLVVRFDLPATYRSYIQSKGRARSADSKYYMLVDEKDVLTFTAHLKKFKGIEKVMTMRCQSREEPEEEAVEARMVDTLLPPYFPVKKDGAPRVTMSSAISLVNRYCAKLPSDSFTHLTPKCKITEEKGDEVGEAGEEVAKMYSATLQLPINSPVKQEIQGKKMATKKLAKMAVALVACEILHKAGELDEHLLPVGKEIIKYEDEENEWEAVETAGQARPGTTKRKQYYSRRVAHDLTGRPRPNQAAYLHAFNMKLTCPVADELNTRGRQVYAPEQTTRSFGILSEHPITSMPLFPVFTRSGQVTLSVDLLASDLVFSERQLDRLTAFHRFIFRHVMRLERDPMIFNPAEADAAYIVVPLNKDADADLEIDWTFVEMIELQLPKFQQKVAPASASSELFVFDEAAFCDAVVMPSYRNIDQPEHFYVAEVRHDLSPLSAFPSETYRTFEHYYCSKYGLPLTAAGSQPLLDVDYTSARLNLLTPRHLNQKGAALPAGTARRRDSLQQKQMLVPELCRLHPVPASLWRKAVCLPTILYRLNQLLLADELRALIGREAGVGAPALPPTHRFSPLAFDFREPNGSALARVRFDAPIAAGMYAGPSPCLILQTLTMSNANDFFSLERLETIGDSFLKFSVTAYLYCQYPRIHEGRLSYLRSKQVSNYNLYRLGRQHRLADCMVAAKFEPAENWLPPGFTVRPVSGINVVIAQPLDKPAAVTANGTSQYDRQLTACTAVEEAADRSIPYNLQTQQSVPDKSVADCVEALIGCYLTSCGQHAALRLMTWLGLDVLPGGGGGGSGGGLPQPDSPLLHEVSDPAHVVKHQLTGYEMFEETIGYKFEDRSYLLQAFTHASYHYNRVTDCYQRLEFLGDAILDYVITRQLFEDPKKHSPGILTDLRSALVNNNMFAALAVKWDFHKYLKFVSPPLFTVIEKFVERQKSLDDEINLDDEFGDTADEDAVDDGEDIEIPKALGDIFESVAGAIYLDSNMSLDTVWRVYHRMMKPLIDTFTEKIPKSPVRALLELEPETAKFQKPERTVEGKIRVSVNVVGKGVFKGIGRNHRIAKSAAAKRALKVIRECHAEEQKLQGPESDVETESKLTVTELKDLQEQQKKAKESAKLLAAVEDAENVVKESEDDSCAWGISSNDADVYEGENPFSLLEPQNEELYVVDPKKALKGFFEREGLELPEYEITDVGKGNFRCIVELPLMGASGEPLKADVTQDGKKREVVVACALAACRILDMHGELRKATHASRKKKRKNWEDADFYDSDDDTFLDRTGDIEKKRRQRKSRIQKDTEKAASYDSLVTKMDEVKRKMTVIEDQLRKAKHEAEALEAEGLDALDAFMSLIRAGGMDSKTKMLLKKELSELRREEYGLERMLKAACPALPTLDVSLMRPSQRPTLPLTGRMKGPKRHLPAQANAAADKPLKEPVGKQESNDEESDLEEGVEMRDDEPVKEEAASRTSPTVGPGTGADEEGGKGGRNDDGVIGGEGAIDEDVTKDDKGAKDMDATKDDQGTKDIEGRKDDKIDKDEEGTAKDEDSVSGATVEDDTKDEETSNDGGTARLVGPVVSERTSDAGPQLMTRGPVPDGELVHSQHTTQGKDKTTEGKRKSGPSVSQASKKLKKITVSKEYCKNDPAYALWCPPQDQAGDGRTSLNDKYGY